MDTLALLLWDWTNCKIVATIIQGAPQASFEASVIEQKTSAYQAALAAAILVDQANDLAATGVRNNGIDHYLVDEMVNIALQQVVTDMLPKKVLARVKRVGFMVKH